MFLSRLLIAEAIAFGIAVAKEIEAANYYRLLHPPAVGIPWIPKKRFEDGGVARGGRRFP